MFNLRPDVSSSRIKLVLQSLELNSCLSHLLHRGIVDLLVGHVLMVETIAILKIAEDRFLCRLEITLLIQLSIMNRISGCNKR